MLKTLRSSRNRDVDDQADLLELIKLVSLPVSMQEAGILKKAWKEKIEDYLIKTIMDEMLTLDPEKHMQLVYIQAKLQVIKDLGRAIAALKSEHKKT